MKTGLRPQGGSYKTLNNSNNVENRVSQESVWEGRRLREEIGCDNSNYRARKRSACDRRVFDRMCNEINSISR